MKAKKPFENKDHLIAVEKQLMAYSLAAAAILAGTKDARAQIVHTDVIPDAVLDVNGEECNIVFAGQTRFKIKFAQNKSTTTTGTWTPTTSGLTSTWTTTMTYTYTTNKVGVFPEAGNSARGI